jgi:sugar phosphate isomerase/epimerase
MKLGYLTGFSEEECKAASRIGYDCLEVSSGWDLAQLGKQSYRKAEAEKVHGLLDQYGLSISALAIYWAVPKGTGPRVAAYKNYIKFCTELGVGCITALTQCEPSQSLDKNVADWAAVFSKVAPVAEDAGIKIAFENWPGLQGSFPPVGTINFAFNPAAWEKMFEAVPSPALGLEFDPSHLVWQGIDWAAQLVKWFDRVHHVHAKDTEIFEDRLKARGFFSGGWWRYRLPGYGCVDWHKLTSILKEKGYQGAICLEHEDGIFLGERRTEGLEKAHAYLRPLV